MRALLIAPRRLTAKAARRARRLIGRPLSPHTYDVAWEPVLEPSPIFPDLRSQACTQAQLETPEYAAWAQRVGERPLMHRKQWEWCFILQALEERDCISDDRKGLGFGVGTEPITPYLAAHGCYITATDLSPEDELAQHWIEHGQHADDLALVNAGGLCPDSLFRERVTYRAVDMRAIPDDLRDFDFSWSSCAMEHLGSLEAGLSFLENQLDCLRPGGWAVHTTEYNVGSNQATLSEGPTVLYRRRDLRDFARRLRSLGHELSLTFDIGRGRHDRHVDLPPWTESHLKIQQDQFVATSFGLIIRKSAA